MLLSRSPQVIVALLNHAAPSWLLFVADSYGVEARLTPSEEYIRGMRTPMTMAHLEGVLDALPDLDQFIDSLGKCSRKVVCDRLFSNGLSFTFGLGEDAGFVPVGNVHHDFITWLNMIVRPVLVEEFGDGADASSVTLMSTSIAIANCEAVLRNWFQPRWLVTRVSTNKWSFSVNASLLKLAGDVESNPGPIWRITKLLCGVALLWAIWVLGQQLPELPSLAYHLIDRLVLLPMDRRAYECAVIEREHEFWLQQYTAAQFIQLAAWWGKIPSPADLQRLPFDCKVVFALRGKPHVPVFTGPDWYKRFRVIIALMIGCWATFVLIILCVLLVVAVRRGRVVVVNKNGAIDINALKHALKPKLALPSFGKGHEWLATQRRECEAAVIDWILQHAPRFRDVGGSRQRFKNLGLKKHLCAPTASNDDILRELKNDGVFENCGHYGQDCPMKREIPFAMLSHVDYHLTQDELVRTITGPTFLINHDFSSRPDKMGVIGDNHEADVTYHGSRVTMTTRDGTKYSHGYHSWQNEGSVVTNSGAFVYVRLNRFFDTCVYFCYPADGVYSRNDVNVLKPLPDSSLPMIHGYEVHKDHDKKVFTFSRNDHCFDVCSDVVESCAIRLCTSVRDEKYPAMLMSYVASKCLSTGISTSNVDSIVRLVAYLSDIRAVTTVFRATCIQGHPADFRRIDLIKLRFWIWVNNFGPSFLNNVTSRFINCSLARRTVAWTFPKVYVPTYEIYTDRARARYLSTPVNKFGKEQFQSPPTPAHARSDQHPECCTGEDSSEHNHLFGEAGSERCTETPTAPDESSGIESNISDDASDKRAPPVITDASDEESGDGNDQPADKGRGGKRAGSGGPVAGRKDPDLPSRANDPVQPRQSYASTDATAKHVSITNWDDDVPSVIEVTSANAKSFKVDMGLDVFSKLQIENDTDAASFLIFLDGVLQQVSPLEPKDHRRVIVKWLCECAADPAVLGKRGDLELPNCVVRARDALQADFLNFGTHQFRTVGVEVSVKAAGTVAGGENEGGKPRVDVARPGRKEFPKDRDQYERNRPQKHQPQVRRVPEYVGPVCEHAGKVDGRPSESSKGARPKGSRVKA